MKVLIVDDSSFTRNVLKAKFIQYGHETLMAKDGVEGLETAKANLPDLIISDILMPRMDGFQFLRNLKKEPGLQSIPFVFYSITYQGKREKELARTLGADAFIERKKTPEEFWDDLSLVLDTLTDGKSKAVPTELMEDEAEFLRQYVRIVNAKLEKKVEELEKTKEQLSNTSIRLEHFFLYSPAVIYSCEPEYPFKNTFISENVLTQTGYAVEEFMTKPEFWAEHIHPKDTERVFSGMPQLFEKGAHFHEYRFCFKDGSYHWMHDELRLLKDSEGRPQEIIGFWIDISERKKAEEALQKSEEFVKNILESVDEGFVVIDPEYRIILANRAYCEQAKCCVENIVGKHCYEVSHHLDRPCFENGEDCAVRHTLMTGNPYVTIHTHFDKDGSPVYVEEKAYPLKDAAGKVTAVIETVNNLAEKKRLEEQLRHTQKMEAIGTLVGGIAHDFNNMLNVIMGYGGLIEMNMKKDDPVLPRLKEMLTASEKAAELTKGLLIFCRKQVMEIRPVNINEIVNGFKKMLERVIGEDIKFRVVTAGEDLIVKADARQIEQVLMNLSVNARDAMPKGKDLIIETKSLRMDNAFVKKHGFGEPGKYALITVTDTGKGMDEKTMEKMFEPYFTTKEMGRGTGLGLSIVYGIVKQHGGYIDCLSELGKGTTFLIYLPVVGSKAGEIEMAEAEAPEGGKETILIAEDDPAVRGFIKQTLESLGYKVIEAVDGVDAVNKFKEHSDGIDLLLLDVIMPGKNGKEAYEDIKGLKHNIKAIFLSGYTPELVRSRGLIEDDLEFIPKPVMPQTLLRKVREVLDR